MHGVVDFRHHPARSTDLDHLCVASEVLANRLGDLGLAVTQPSQEAHRVHRIEGEGVEIAMATRRRQDVTSAVDRRSRHLPVGDGRLDVETESTHFSSRGHASHEGAVEVDGRPGSLLRNGIEDLLGDVRLGDADEVGVALPQPWHRHGHGRRDIGIRRCIGWTCVADRVSVEYDRPIRDGRSAPRNQQACIDADGHAGPLVGDDTKLPHRRIAPRCSAARGSTDLPVTSHFVPGALCLGGLGRSTYVVHSWRLGCRPHLNDL